MNSQLARIPASKQPTGEKPRTKSKIFFSFKTPDLRPSPKSPNEFAFYSCCFSSVRNALNTAARTKREEPTDQECAGGACAKMCALRKSGLTHVAMSNAVAAKQTSNCGAVMSGG